MNGAMLFRRRRRRPRRQRRRWHGACVRFSSLSVFSASRTQFYAQVPLYIYDTGDNTRVYGTQRNSNNNNSNNRFWMSSATDF